MLKKSLHLKAQLSKVKAEMNVSAHAQGIVTSHSKPTATAEVEALGSGLAPWLVLATGQSTYLEEVVSLKGVMPINLSLHYLSPYANTVDNGLHKGFHKGFFGVNRTSSFEKYFSHRGQGRYTLALPCGRVFVFTKQKDGTFTDEGKLGVEVKVLDANSFELAYFDGQREYYSQGYLVGIKDTNNNMLTLQYAQGPKLIQISNSFGASLRLDYNAKGLVSSAKDHSAREWTFAYDETDTLLSIRLETEHLVSYGYERRMLRDKQVNLLSHVYNASKKEQLAFSYNAEAKLTSYTQAGVKYEYSYSDESHIQREDAQGQSHSYTLDNMGLIASLTYPDATMTVEKYDASTKTATIQTRGENLRVEVYDDRARLLSISVNGNIEQVYGYEAKNPHPVSYIADSKTLYYSYDDAYNLLSVIYPDKSTQNYSYTKEGQLSSHSDALGNSTKYSYDDKANLVSIEEPNQSKSNFTYDALGRLLTQEDALGEKRSYSYNTQDQVQSYSDPEGNAINFSYSKEGQLQSLTDPANRTTTYSYDAHERLIEKRYPNGSKESYTYHANASLQSIHRVDGTTVHFSYDSNENICQVIAKDREGKEEVLEYDYDALSNLQSAKTKAHTIALQYNEKASIIKETQNNLTLHKTYAQNQKQKQSLGFLGEWVHYAYDGSQNISDISHQNQAIKLSYNANHLSIKRAYPNKQKEQLSYDANQNLIALENPTKKHKIEYSYDASSKLIKKTDTQSKQSTAYTYTPSGALSQATSIPSTGSGTGGVTQFSYNAAGNQTQNQQTYNSLNQLIEDEETLYSYDARGNLKEKFYKSTRQRSHYVFNLFDQLIKVKRVDSNNTLLEGFSFSYDALNRRVSKTTYTSAHFDKLSDQSSVQVPSSTTHHYLYDEENIIAILDHNKDLLASIIHDTNTDTPLSITTHQNEAKPLNKYEKEILYTNLTQEEKQYIHDNRKQRTYYYHRDHQGSITALTNEVGDIVESFLYDEAYGTILDHHKTEETYNPYCYTGREFDSHDLYYYRARYYDPSVGRFISSDPIEFLAGDFNFYRYVGGDPVNRADPTGLFDPAVDAIMRSVDHDLPTTRPMTWEDFVPDCVAAAKDLFSGDLSIGAAVFNAIPIVPNLPKSTRKKKKECDKKEKAQDGDDGESVEKKKTNPQCKKLGSKFKGANDRFDDKLEKYEPTKGGDDPGTEFTGQGGKIGYTKLCGHFYGVLKELNSMQTNIEKLKGQKCPTTKQNKDYNKAKKSAKSKLDQARPECKQMWGKEYAKHF